MKAEGVHAHSVMKLGKQEKKVDKKTVHLTDFINRDIVNIPDEYNFDKDRKPFTTTSWGNTSYGDCVLATRANHLLRMERAETRSSVRLTDEQVIALYKRMTGCVSPGDANDSGLVMLDALKDWRAGWSLRYGITNKERKYTVDAFGSLGTNDEWLLRAGVYLFTGIQFGFAMPVTAQAQTSEGFWRVDNSSAYESQPGSWGGHAVYAYAYDDEALYVMSWGKKIKVYNDFIHKYADEAWAVIDSFDAWRKTHGVLDVQKLLDYFAKVGIKTVH